MSLQKEENKNVDKSSRKTEESTIDPQERHGDNVNVDDWKHAASRTKEPSTSPEGSETEGVNVDDWKHAWEVGCFKVCSCRSPRPKKLVWESQILADF